LLAGEIAEYINPVLAKGISVSIPALIVRERLVSSFLGATYILVSFLGGEPPPVTRISKALIAMAAEH